MTRAPIWQSRDGREGFLTPHKRRCPSRLEDELLRVSWVPIPRKAGCYCSQESPRSFPWTSVSPVGLRPDARLSSKMTPTQGAAGTGLRGQVICKDKRYSQQPRSDPWSRWKAVPGGLLLELCV